jgi:hypothetical protein
MFVMSGFAALCSRYKLQLTVLMLILAISLPYSAALVLPPAMPGAEHYLYQDYRRMMRNIER